MVELSYFEFGIVVFELAGLCGVAIWLAHRLGKAEARIDDLLNKPLSFWEWRERNRKVMQAAAENMDRLAAMTAKREIIPPEGDKVKFRRPQPYKTEGY